MNTSKQKVLGIVLIAGAVLVALTIQFLGSGLITTKQVSLLPNDTGRLVE